MTTTLNHALSPTERTRVRRHSERAQTERADLFAVLDAGMICHLGVIMNGSPVVLPTAYGRIGETLYLHGSSANRSMHAADGHEVCVTVTHVDGLVCARAAFTHSVNYRSAVVFGTARIVTDEAERLAGLRAVTEQLIPGRWDAVRAPTRKELAATSVLALPLSTTKRTTLHRLRERGRAERAELYAVLDAGLICHMGVVVDGSPVVLPTGYGRTGDTLYLHGSSANRALLAADGQQVCVTVTHLDGLVCARSVFHHSMNYRSAMIFGAARLLFDDSERLAALRAVTEQLVPGRWDHVRGPTRKELAATAVLELSLQEASVKVRTGPPKDEPEDLDAGIWAGVLPLGVAFGAPVTDPELPAGIDAPDHIRARIQTGNR